MNDLGVCVINKIELKNVKLDYITPYSDNPRKNKKAISKVAESITTHGYLKTSIGVDEDMILLYGHTTLEAIKLIGWKTIPEVSQFTGLPEHIKISYRIADNRTGEYAEWDYDKLYLEVQKLSNLSNFSGNLSSTGMTPAELNALRKAHEGTTEQSIPEPITTDIKTGDIIQLGKHKLLCGDSTNPDCIIPFYNGEIASIIFTSPPYNIGKEYWLESDTKYEDQDDDSNVAEYLQFLKTFTSLHLSHCVYLFLNMQMVKGNKLALMEYLNSVRFNLADIIIWDKQTAQPAMGENILNSQFEFIIILKDSPANRKVGTQKFRGTVSNIYSAPPNRENKHASIHSASFPLHLPTHIIKNFTNPGDIVSDPFLGLGTTLLACEQLNRVCYGIEKSPIFCEIICKRWEVLSHKSRVILPNSV